MTSPAQVAVILVAGVGQRLRPITDDRPKALVSVAGVTLLGRAMEKLAAHGVTEVALATGYYEDRVREAVASVGLRVHFCRNDRFDSTQNAVSLLHCEDAVAGRAFYKLDGDLLFRGSTLTALDDCDAGIVAAVDRRAALGEEEMKVLCDSDGRIRSFGKWLVPSESFGESIGLERIREDATGPLFRALREATVAGETHLYYEDIYARLIERGEVDARAVCVARDSWMEIDTHEDLAAAERLALSQAFAD